MILIKELDTKIVKEYRLGFFKRDLMLLEICSGFGLIPFELNHKYIVFMSFSKSSRKM